MQENYIKITGAVYKILDFFPDQDPLKNRAKEKALAILDNLTLIFDSHGWISLKSYLSEEKEKNAKQALEDIEMLESYLRIGKDQGWIDAVNFLIILKEYATIKAEISKRKHSGTSFKEEVKNLPVGSMQMQIISQLREMVIVEDKEEKAKAKSEKPKFIKSYTERQKKILKILKSKGRGQVSDIIKELPDVTKRTIRRDLDDLLKRGEIIRVGEWNQIYYKLR